MLATAHKAKGLEWARVRLASDFPSLEELDALDQDGLPHLTPEERDQELHLLYVAVTRARQQLEPNEAVRSCLASSAPAGRGCAAWESRFRTSAQPTRDHSYGRNGVLT